MGTKMKQSLKLSSSLEDYLEAIYNLSAHQQVARSKDIAGMLGVSCASVTSALRNLSEKELINYKPYGYITLTDKGRKVAGKVVRRHDILTQFFAEVLGIDAETAQEAACRAEHTLEPEITSRLTAFIDFLTQSQQEDRHGNLVQQFQRYWKNSQ
jgi:DtxR family transcriptional regulator, Mn-dependent transcriptional regulator